MASKLGDYDQRLILFILGTACIFSGGLVMVLSRRIAKLPVTLLMVAEFLLSLLLPVFFALGPNMWRVLAIEWTALALLVVDALAFPLGLAAVNILHCPCPGSGAKFEDAAPYEYASANVDA